MVLFAPGARKGRSLPYKGEHPRAINGRSLINRTDNNRRIAELDNTTRGKKRSPPSIVPKRHGEVEKKRDSLYLLLTGNLARLINVAILDRRSR